MSDITTSAATAVAINTATTKQPSLQPPPVSFVTSLIAGGIAGTCVDVSLYPIDTIKTRIQSTVGFWKAGGFRNIYNGLSITALGSAPGAALFFSTYETMKPLVLSSFQQPNENVPSSSSSIMCHMIAASTAEAVACLVRVPTEVIKAKMQTTKDSSLYGTIQLVLQEHNSATTTNTNRSLGGLYRGYGITLFREIPFAMIQFPLYEYFKVLWKEQYRNGMECTPIQSAICGSISGAVAAALTTPLDVLKTRHMIGYDHTGRMYHGIQDVYRSTIQQDGYSALWKGIQPRVIWITIGGFVFFGSYEQAKQLVSPIFQ